MTIDITFLKSTPYFSRIKNEDLDLVGNLFFEKIVDKGDIVLLQDEPAEALYFLSSGVMRMFRTSVDGKEQTLKFIHPRESFNDVAIFDNGSNLASVQAMESAIVYGILQRDLHAFVQRYPQTAIDIINVLVVELRHLVLLVDDLSFRPVASRVAKILLEYAGNGISSSQRLTQQDMAAIGGTVREVVGRSLKALEANGVIRMDRHQIIITDRHALEDIAGISP